MSNSPQKPSIKNKVSLWAGTVTAAMVSLLSTGAYAELKMNMPYGVTPTSHSVYGLHMTVVGLCAVAAVLVYGVIVYSLVKHRKSKGAVAAQFHESTTVEVIWTAIPMLILVLLAIPATRTLIAMEDSREAEMTIKVTGYQWKWHYDYLDNDFGFYSTLSTPASQIYNEEAKTEDYLLEVDNPMVVPVNTKVRILTTSNDVIHSWWVPELGWKKDAIPGMVNDAWTLIEEEGTYRGQCAELCGKDHGFMPIVVEAVSQEEYDKWVAEQQAKNNS